MRHKREFEIAWQGLKPGVHLFEYEIDHNFMQEHGEAEEDLKDLSAKVKLSFDKQSNFFMLHFDVDGSVTVPCDRCGDDFTLQLWDEFDLLIKLAGENAEGFEEESDAVFIPRSETVLDISKWLYEFVMLSIPLQRIHPNTPEGETGCNPAALSLLNEMAEREQEEKPANNFWKGLEALKKRNKNNERNEG